MIVHRRVNFCLYGRTNKGGFCLKYDKPVLIAEIGCNHKGSVKIAKKMIDKAIRFCGADIVKFQKRDPKKLLTKEEYNSPHPVPANSYGDTYGEHREFLEFDIDTHKELKEYAENLGGEYSVSVWDWNSTKEVVEELRPKHIKLPSALATHFEIYKYIIDNLPEAILHISTGMTTQLERKYLLREAVLNKALDKTVFYLCTSTYPAQFEDLCLLSLDELTTSTKKSGLGYSGHHKGIAIDIAAYTLGAQYIERHFTLDRTWKGTDHAASLEPQGLRKLKRDLMATHKALTRRPKNLLEKEKSQAKKLRWDRTSEDF